MLKNTDNWGGLGPADNKWHNEMYDKYVPGCGKADTIGGEILRAINRIIYKFYNDGDTVARYYSSSRNHSFGAETFLSKYVPTYVPMRAIVEDEAFEEAACSNLKRIIDYLRETPGLFELKNFDDFLDLSPYEEWVEDWEEEDWEDDDWGDEDYEDWEEEEEEENEKWED